MDKLNFLGIGPRVAFILLPWLGTSIVLSIRNIEFFKLTSWNTDIIMIVGIVLMIAGLVFYFRTVRLLLKGLRENRLVTQGPYSYCQHPLYASLILCVIPSLSLILNSWLILTSSIIGFFLFKVYIKNENRELEKFFGEDYLIYKRKTPEFFPLLIQPG